MKKLVIAAAALALSAGTAVAQDAAFDWSGLYAGLQGGYGLGDADITGTSGSLFSHSIDPKGGFVGAHVGAQWQNGIYVFGAEAEINTSSIDGTSTPPTQPTNFFTADIDWFGAANAKLGIAMDKVLLYGTAGISLARIDTRQARSPDAFSMGATYVGWTVGAGVDYAVTDNIIAGFRYRYYDFGNESFVPPSPFTPRDQDVTLHTIGVGLAYKF